MTDIVVTIKTDGKVVVDVQGGTGEKCLDLTKGIEDALGEKTDGMRKAEFYEPVPKLRVRSG
jgi:hypothetical protein